MSGVELSPGVIVDPERAEAYVMSPDGNIVSIGLDQGLEVWRTDKAAKPLLLSGDLLLGQVERTEIDGTLRIASLKTREQGALASESVVPLPAGVTPIIEQRANRAFIVKAQPLDGDAAVSWEFLERRLTGLPPGPMEVLPGEEPSGPLPSAAPPVLESMAPAGLGIVQRGAVRLSPSDGTVTPMMETQMEAVPGAVPSAGIAPGTESARDAHLPNIPEPQFQSADGRHILHSERVADDTEWDRYLWRIFEESTQQQIGEFRYHSSFSPFIIVGNRAVVMSQPYERRIGGELVGEPRQIRSFNLNTGSQIWRQPVRETTNANPPPP